MLHDLRLHVPARLLSATEHRRAADDEDTRLLVGSLVLDELVEGFVDAGVLVGGAHEGLAFLFEHGAGAVDCWVDERDDFEAGAEFAGSRRLV